MLAPQHLRLRRAARDGMRILDLGVERLVGRHVLGAHAVRGLRPRSAPIVRDPGAPAAHAHQHGAAREGTDRMDAGDVVAAAIPGRPFGPVPERFVEVPAEAVIGRAEQAAGQGACVERGAAALDGPHQGHLPCRPGRTLGLRRKCRGAHFAPACTGVVGRVQLHAEMAQAQRGEHPPRGIGRQHHAHRIADEARPLHRPAAGAPPQFDQALARGHPCSITHAVFSFEAASPQPPVSA